jgi:hypothetical protein
VDLKQNAIIVDPVQFSAFSCKDLFLREYKHTLQDIYETDCMLRRPLIDDGACFWNLRPASTSLLVF